MLKRGFVLVASGSLAVASLVTACSSRSLRGGTTQAGAGGGQAGSGTSEIEDAGAAGAAPANGAPPGGAGAGNESELGGAGAGNESELGGAGAGNEAELGGAGAGNDPAEIEKATAALETAVTSALAGRTLLTDPTMIAGTSFELRDCIGPFEGLESWSPTWLRYDGYDPDNSIGEPFCPKLTLHFVTDGDGLAVVVEMPTEIFPFAERVSLERRGDAWLAKGLPTSNHLCQRWNDVWYQDFYYASLAMFAFPEGPAHGGVPSVAAAATNGFDSVGPSAEWVDSDYVIWGKPAGLAVSPGSWKWETRPIAEKLNLGTSSPIYRPDVNGYYDSELGLGDMPVLTLTQPVNSDSTFYFENALGQRSIPKLIKTVQPNGAGDEGDYIQGLLPVDYLGEGWDLVGEGTTLRGEHFTSRWPLALVDIGVASGDFESATPWYYPTDHESCLPVDGAGVAESWAGLPAIAGAHSFYASGCPRVRVQRAPGATQLKFEARRAEPCAEGSMSGRVIAMAPGGETIPFSKPVDCSHWDEIITVTAALPATGDDLLVELPDGYWIDSLRTE